MRLHRPHLALALECLFFLQPPPVFLSLAQEVTGAYSLIISAKICLLTAVYIYVVIPETKGPKIFVEINRIFTKRNRAEVPEEGRSRRC